jgi:hypothetical protein
MARTMLYLPQRLIVMLHIRRFVALGIACASFMGSQVGRAQTTTTCTCTVAQSDQMYPDRIVNGVDEGESTRPQNLNPYGVSYADCIADMTLRFYVNVSGFDGNENLQIWAGKEGNCTTTPERGIGAIPTCWMLNGGFTLQPYDQLTTLTFDIRVQDLVGPQNAPPNPPGYVAQGPSACNAQPSFAAVPINVSFIPLDTVGNPLGTAYIYSQSTDLVGPPAPTGVGETVGDTLFNVTWMANVDTDTAAYDVYIDPLPGQTSVATVGPSDASVLVCPDTGVATPSGNDSGDGDDGDDGPTPDATVDASATPTADAGCYLINVGSSASASGTCGSTLLTSGIVQDAGGIIQEVDEAGDLIEGGVVESGNGGISTIPCQNIVGAGCSSSVTVSDKSIGSYTITGLTNNVTYNVVVAAVDGSGNIGPPSTEVCDYPSPVNDFWDVYRQDGGLAGGGLCALEAVGMPVSSSVGLSLFAGASVLAVRRRRARKRDERRDGSRTPR